MGYTALLFCPEEKTARTVTQVLSELEFTVEACIEPFAAVKKLMGQHFDAVVVDCDNEQNATLLFKSARNSASNQTSLAVAVVEGQTGVAKAFRIGANLVLTKPINIESAKGTLRVARGLLRKAEPVKGAGAPVGSAVAEAAPAAKSAPSKSQSPHSSQTRGEGVHPAEEPKSTEPVAAAPVFATQPTDVPVVKPTPAWSDPDVASALAEASAQDDDLLGIEEKPESKPKPAPGAPPAGSPILPSEIFAARGEAKPALLGVPANLSTSGGAASAPAPAKEAPVPKKSVPSTADDDVLDTTSEATKAPSGIVGSAPSFTFGGGADQESSGGGKKIFIGIAAAVVVAAGLYFGWSHFHGSGAEQPASAEPALSTPAPVATPQPAKSSGRPSADKPSAPSSTSAPTGTSTSEEPSHPNKKAVEDESGSEPESAKPNSKSSAEDSPEAAPLMVKSGKAPAKKKGAASEADAPSVIGLAPGDAAPMPDLGTASDAAAFKPTLQTVNVSQGVSQGLLIKKVPPSYPASALRMRIEGKVELLATISKDGEISHIKVLSGDSQLTKAATDAVSKWKYKPYLLNGEPVEIQTQVTVNFKLPTQ